MKVLIDTCVIPLVFGGKCPDYYPVHEFIYGGRGHMVVGGSKYREEISRMRKFAQHFAELARAKKLVHLNDEIVDEDERRIRGMEDDPDFDDPHIVAILNISNCKVLCTTDSRSDRFTQDRKFYNHLPVPSIYRRRDHGHLLRDRA